MRSPRPPSGETAAPTVELDQIFTASQSALCILRGPDHRWEKVNPVYQELLFPGVELIGRSVREVVPDADAQGFGVLLDQVYATGQAREGRELRLQVSGRPAMYFDFVYAPIHGRDGAVTGIFVEAHDVTGQVLTRQALEAAEAGYRGIFEHAAEGIFRTSPEGRLLLANPSLARIFGYASPEEMLAEVTNVSVQLYLDPARRAELMRLLAERDSVTGYVLGARRKDGSNIWLSLSVRTLRHPDGSRREFEGIAEDITERQHAAEALRESEARYRTLFENFPNGSVFLFDHNLRYTVASGTGLAAAGLDLDMFTGKTLWEIFPPEIAERDAPILGAALRGETTRVEVPFGAKTFLVHTIPVKDERGVIVGGMVMTQDITDRKQGEQRLQFLAEASAILGASLDYDATLQSIARLAVPLLGDKCAVFILAPDGAIRQVAAAPADLGAEPPPRPVDDAVIDPASDHPVAVTIRTGRPATAASSAGAAGSLPPAHVIMPLAVREQILGAIMFGWDAPGREYDTVESQLAGELTQRAAQAVDHSRLYRELQEALRMRDEFLAIAAHEIKTPLTTVLGSAEVLQRRAARTPSYTLTERDQRSLRVIAQQSRRLQQQIESLLDVSQIRAGRLQLDMRPTDLCRFVERVINELQPTLERHQVTFSCEQPSLIVHGDELRLDQVLQNLLQNAVKYSPDGGEIAVRVLRRGNEAHIEVADQGIGIPAQAQALLFERFFRARNATSLGIGGMGIGLAVVTDIVARHGGRVEVTSVEGEGSTFTVCLPEASSPGLSGDGLA